MEVEQIVYEKMDCDLQFMTALLEKFKESSAELLDRIETSISEENCGMLLEYTHALKGELLIFNAAGSSIKLEALEAACKAGNISVEVGSIVNEIREDAEDIVVRFTEFVKKKGEHQKNNG